MSDEDFWRTGDLLNMLRCPSRQLRDLAEAAREDPKTFYKYADLSGLDLERQDLSGMVISDGSVSDDGLDKEDNREESPKHQPRSIMVFSLNGHRKTIVDFKSIFQKTPREIRVQLQRSAYLPFTYAANISQTMFTSVYRILRRYPSLRNIMVELDNEKRFFCSFEFVDVIYEESGPKITNAKRDRYDAILSFALNDEGDYEHRQGINVLSQLALTVPGVKKASKMIVVFMTPRTGFIEDANTKVIIYTVNMQDMSIENREVIKDVGQDIYNLHERIRGWTIQASI